jgi:hypothetical protein
LDRSQIEQLEKLASLKEKGILTEEEFRKKKYELLSARHENIQANPNSTPPKAYEGSYLLPIPSLVLGIVCILGVLDTSAWDKDKTVGLLTFSVISLVFGISSVSSQEKGKGMAIAGIVMSSISLLAFLGMHST